MKIVIILFFAENTDMLHNKKTTRKTGGSLALSGLTYLFYLVYLEDVAFFYIAEAFKSDAAFVACCDLLY